MANIGHVVLFSLLGGVFSLVGGFLLIRKKNVAHFATKYATPFAAGALLAAAFVDLLNEAAHVGDIEVALRAALFGILIFFLLERFLHWFHHHHEHEEEKHDPTVSLVVIGDTLHNFIDGIAIAAGFLVDVQTGAIVTLAVAAHEIPQEIGDFGLLLAKGLHKSKVILVNVASALATVFSAVLFFQIGQNVVIPLDVVLGVVAGFFIYIAVSDIIPSIHKNEDKTLAGPQTLLLLLGVLVVGAATTYLHQYIEPAEAEHSHAEEIHSEEHKEEKHSEEHSEEVISAEKEHDHCDKADHDSHEEFLEHSEQSGC